MDELNYYDRIEAYVESQLSKEEINQFDQDLLTNEELKLEYDAYLLTQEASFVLGYEQLNLQPQAKEIHIDQTPKKFQLKKWLVAASIILAMGFTTWWANFTYSNEALAFNEFTETNVSSSRSPKESDEFKVLKDAFGRREYNQTIVLARHVADTDSLYIEMMFIVGHAYIKLGKYASAIPSLQMVALTDNSLNAGNAQWNLALCYVLTDQPQNAIDVLDRIIADPTADYRTKAIELKHKLNSIWRKLII